jgi:hypothetical protein
LREHVATVFFPENRRKSGHSPNRKRIRAIAWFAAEPPADKPHQIKQADTISRKNVSSPPLLTFTRTGFLLTLISSVSQF